MFNRQWTHEPLEVHRPVQKAVHTSIYAMTLSMGRRYGLRGGHSSYDPPRP